jgi:hypothetical protein
MNCGQVPTSRLRLPAALLVATACVLAPSLAEAKQLFTTDIAIPGDTASDGTNKFPDIPDLFSEENLDALFSGAGYDPTMDPFAAVLDVRGLLANLSWTPDLLVPADSTLELIIDGVLDITLDAATLDEALDLLEDWLDGDLDLGTAPEDALTDLLQSLVENSPVDPVAGNPSSLESRMFTSDYRLGTEGPFTSGDDRLEAAPNLLGLGAEYSYFKGGDWSGNLVELPIDYRFNFRNPKWSLLFNLPLTVTFTEGQWSLIPSAALGAQFRPTPWWSLTPIFRFGGAGSIDVGAFAVMYSATLTNHMKCEWRGLTFGMGNMGGFAKTFDGISIGGHDVSYDLTNPVLRNGAYVSGQIGSWAGWKLFGSNMLLFGDDLYADSQNEVGAAIYTLGSIGEQPYQSLAFDVSYLFGKDYDAVSLRLRFRF